MRRFLALALVSVAACGGATSGASGARASARRVTVPMPDALDKRGDAWLDGDGVYVDRSGERDRAFCASACDFTRRPTEAVLGCSAVRIPEDVATAIGWRASEGVLCVLR